MTNTNTHPSINKKSAFLLGFGLVVIVVLVAFIITELRTSSYESQLRAAVADQNAFLVTVAELTARNAADSVTESIVQDCPVGERVRFDLLLGSLDQGLTQTELTELDALFASCGSFFAERKAVMVARLQREIEILEGYNRLYEQFADSDAIAEQMEGWRELLEGEQMQSVLISELVRLQKDIIDELLAGRNATSPEILSILSEVRESREALLLANTQTDALRSTLSSL
jgi:hypothetical protein